MVCCKELDALGCGAEQHINARLHLDCLKYLCKCMFSWLSPAVVNTIGGCLHSVDTFVHHELYLYGM